MSLAHLLDDYLDTIDYLPADLSTALSAIHARATEAAELHRTLTRRRNLYLRPSASTTSTSTNDTTGTRQNADHDQLRKKINKERARLEELIKEKMDLQEQVRKAAGKQLARLDAALKKHNAQVQLHGGHAGVVEDVPWPELVCAVCHAGDVERTQQPLQQCANCHIHCHAQCQHACSSK